MSDELLEQLRALAPWHMDIALTPDLRTGAGNPGEHGTEDVSLSLVNPRELRPLLKALYPGGLQGKRFLDCACNAGGYSFLARDLGARHCFGFDVREHWIEQARFVHRHLGKTDDEIRFEVCDLLDVARHVGDERFDICLFKGIFYHLPDPVASLKLVADRTDEVLILDSAAATGYEDGLLKLFWEGDEHPMSGVHNLAWRPTGPLVLTRILEWLGFTTTCTVFWRQRPRRPHRGRIRIVGARDPARLAGLATPPIPTVEHPAEGTTLGGPVELRATVAKRVVEVERLEFRLTGGGLDDSLVAVVESGGRGRRVFTGSWDPRSVPSGAYTLSCVAVDAAGRTGRSVGTRVTVRPG